MAYTNQSVDNRLRSTSQKLVEYALKASWGDVSKNILIWWYILQTSWKRLDKMSLGCLKDGFKTSSRLLEGISKTSSQDVNLRLNQDVLKTSWRCLLKTYDQSEYIGLDQDVFKMFSEDEDERRLQKTPSRRLHQDKCMLGWDLLCYIVRIWKHHYQLTVL